MLEVKIPKEIRDYKEKVIFGFNYRQLGSIAVTLAICVPLVFFGRKYISVDILTWLVLLIAAPIIAFGWAKWQEMKFEEIVTKVGSFYIHSQKRKYTELGTFYHTRKEIIANEILRMTAEKKGAKRGTKKRHKERSIK